MAQVPQNAAGAFEDCQPRFRGPHALAGTDDEGGAFLFSRAWMRYATPAAVMLRRRAVSAIEPLSTTSRSYEEAAVIIMKSIF